MEGKLSKAMSPVLFLILYIKTWFHYVAQVGF